ncbi:hypothetical protein OG689_02525 [Kitasatospora sp. NBC_00240]|uniref:hypothetical protein n=1 Tax=Kitasatospora sp. NBC_00240 TaxID=2903567 RepID=UPI00224F4A1E|nr:hypothetical protein [Kitasatospora sp. NBC_00240]MCX5208192.1 hypothetical protein [Kitasatospora sp. NBC_00240]
MKEFDRELAHRNATDLSHLKDEVDRKNTEHIDRARATSEEPAGEPEDDEGGSPADRTA